jgi:serine/threonine protein kinase
VQLELRFKIQGDPLGEGNFGKVYRAGDVDRGRLIAVKLLRKLTGSTKNEVSHLSRLNNVCFIAFPGAGIEAN